MPPGERTRRAHGLGDGELHPPPVERLRVSVELARVDDERRPRARVKPEVTRVSTPRQRDAQVGVAQPVPAQQIFHDRGVELEWDAQRLGRSGKSGEVRIEPEYAPVIRAHGLEEPVAIEQPAVERRNHRALLVDEPAVEVDERHAGSSAPMARMSARALSTLSSYSPSGSLSATMPPPAWNQTSSPILTMVRMAIFRSARPAKSR